MFCDSGLGLLSGCPSTTDKWFNRHSLAKKKEKRKEKKKGKKKKNPVQICIFPWGIKVTPASALCTYCTVEEWRTCAKKATMIEAY